MCDSFQVIRTAALTQWATSMDISPKGHLIAFATEGRESQRKYDGEYINFKLTFTILIANGVGVGGGGREGDGKGEERPLVHQDKSIQVYVMYVE